MRNLTRGLALAVVSALALTGCVRVEMNVTLAEDDTASGDFIFAISQELLEVAGEDSIDELLGSEESIPGGKTERYESADDDGDGSPDFVGTQTTFSDLPLDEFDAAGDGLRIVRDGDDYVVSGVADDITEQTGGEELPDTATATMSITFPGEVSDHNGELDGTTVTWDLLSHTGEIKARGSASADSGFPLWIMLVLLGIVGVGAGIAGVLIVSSRRKSADQSQVGAGVAPAPGSDTPIGDPIDAPSFSAGAAPDAPADPGAADAPTEPAAPAQPATPVDPAPAAPVDPAAPVTPVEPAEPLADEPASDQPVADEPASDEPGEDTPRP